VKKNNGRERKNKKITQQMREMEQKIKLLDTEVR
jgi:hypothetical protein